MRDARIDAAIKAYDEAYGAFWPDMPIHERVRQRGIAAMTAAINAILPERDDFHSLIIELVDDAQDLRDAERTFNPEIESENNKLGKRQEEVRLTINRVMAAIYGEGDDHV